MDRFEQGAPALPGRVARIEVLAGLERALDLAYRRVVRSARGQWERSFQRVTDPSDACVRVTIRSTTESNNASPGAGLLPSKSARFAEPSRLPWPRLAR